MAKAGYPRACRFGAANRGQVWYDNFQIAREGAVSSDTCHFLKTARLTR